MNRKQLKEYDLRMVVRTKESSDGQYLHAEAFFVYINEKGEVLWPSSTYTGDPLFGLSNLRVGGQMDQSYATKPSPDFYGWGVSYREVYSVDLAEAKAMAATLSQIARKQEQLEKVHGYAVDMTNYIARVASVYGVTKYGLIVREGRGFHYPNEYRWVGVNEVRYFLRDAVDEWKVKHNIKTEQEEVS